MLLQFELLQQLAGARVQGQYHGHIAGDFGQRADDAFQPCGVVGVLGPVAGSEREALFLEVERFKNAAAGSGAFAIVERYVVHHVADIAYALAYTFARQILDGRVGGAQQQGGNAVGEDAVDFLGHAHVERAQAGLDMRHRDVQLGRRQGAGKRGVGVAVDQHPVGFFVEQDLLDALEHASGHGAMGASGNLQVVFGCRNFQLVEKHLGHVRVVVLTGMHHDFFESAGMLEYLPGDRRRLDELWASPHDGEDSSGHAPRLSCRDWMIVRCAASSR